MSQLAALGKYHILERLAADEVAEIYKVKTVGIAGFEKVQILKRILPHHGRDPKFVRAFVDEAKIAFALNHRNIVQVFEFGKIDSDLFLATEYIPGVNLQKVMLAVQQQRRPVPIGLTCYLMGEVAAGLEYAHRKTDHFGQEMGVVHCALAPRNIACSFEGSVKILDFGFARAVWAVMRKHTQLRADPRYASPEQVRGEPLDARADLFSFGVILWELLAGRALFEGGTVEATANAILQAEVPPPRSLNPDVPPQLEELALHCLVRERDARIGAASDLQLELHRIQRTLGAVIGSRALSTFLEELLPDHGEARDVRQEASAELGVGKPPASSHLPTDALVDAAAELAEPPNPPAQPVPEWSPSSPRRAQPSQPALDAPKSVTLEVDAVADEEDDAAFDTPVVELVPSAPAAVNLITGPLPREAQPAAPEHLEPPAESPSSEALRPADTRSAIAAPSAPLGEKKRFIGVAVVLLGPPALQQEAATLIADIAYKLDGIIHQREGERLVIAFGLPAADENDIVSAVRLALDAREAVANLGPDCSGAGEKTAPCTVKIGIRAGTARLGSTSSGRDYQVLGNAVEQMLALAHQAAPGQILVAGAAAPLAAAHYLLREQHAVDRRGKPTHCHRLLGPRLRPRRGRPARDAAFVGREVELRAMRTLWREVLLRGAQRTVVVAGEAGIGKTRLLDEFLSNHAPDARSLVVAATPHRRATPHAVLVDLLRAASGDWGAQGGRSRARLFESLQLVLGDGEPQAMEVLRALLGGQAEPFGRIQVQVAMRAFVNRLAATRPTVIGVDDLHWADSESSECIGSLVEHADQAAGPLLFVLTQRLEGGAAPKGPPEGASFVLLEELDDRDRQRLILEELGERATPELIDELVRRAGGNPFYVTELTRALCELNAKGPSEIPSTVQGVVAARLDRLPADVKLVLQHAAVIGPSFREGILAKLVGSNPARPLAVLRNANLIVPGLRTAAPSVSSPGLSEQFEREWAFRHVLIQELMVEAISTAARRNLHRQVAEIMRKRIDSGWNDSPAELARHLEASGQTALAADVLRSNGS